MGRYDMKRIKVLLIAHEFSPQQGSECAVGWNIATKLAERHDVTVLCADGPPLHGTSYKRAVTSYFTENPPKKSLKTIFVTQPSRAVAVTKLGKTLRPILGGLAEQGFFFWALKYWYDVGLNTIKRLGLRNYDVVHHITPISFLAVSPFWKAGIPFFWGPTGGLCRAPFSYAAYGGYRSVVFEFARSCGIWLEVNHSTSFKGAVSSAAGIWVVSKEDFEVMRKFAPGKIRLMIDTAPPEGLDARVRTYDGTRPLRLFWSGRFVPRKALPILLNAVASMDSPERVVLHILGNGPEKARWIRMASALGIGELVRWYGRIPYSEALRVMDMADVLVHTSFREAASMVVLEAIGLGMPIVCHDICGMSIAVDSTCGLKVPLSTPTQSIKGFRDAILRLLYNPGIVRELSIGALSKASMLSWEKKASEISQAYAESVG